MRLVHLANFNSNNIGNGALIYGAERVLREDLGNQLEFTPAIWDDYTFGLKKFDRNFVELVNQSDGLLVGGAVTFNGRDYLRDTGMRIELPLEMWPEIKKPIIFYGISYKVWPGQHFYHLDKLRKLMEYLLNSPRVFFGVRNDGTKEWLENLIGYRSEKILVVPDPALYVTVKSSEHPELSKSRKNIIISLNNEDEIYRFAGPLRKIASNLLWPFLKEKSILALWQRVPNWDHRKKKFLKRLAAAVTRIATDWDPEIILAAHYFHDYKIMDEFINYCPPRIAHQLMISTGLLGVPQTEYFYDRYAKADLALSMRVHSMSPAIGLGTPVIPLASQPRMYEFLKAVKLDDLSVDVFSDDVEDRIYRLATNALENPAQLKDRLVAITKELRQQTRNYNKKVAEILRNHS